MATVASLVSRFTGSARLYLQTMHGVEEPAAGRGRRYWIISRGLCQFFKVPLLADAAAGAQSDALALEVERLSPFSDTGSHLHLGNDFASVWLWDHQAVRTAAEAIDIEIDRMHVMPETALLPPGTEEVRLVEAMDGVEGQSWIDGGLAASRWWAAPPDDRSWVLFQRGASVPPERFTASPPLPITLGWLERPWTQSRSSGSFTFDQVDFRVVAACGVVLLAIAYGYFGAEWLRLERDIHRLRGEIAERSVEIGPVLQASTQAFENEAAIRTLMQFDKLPSQLAVMARVADILPKNETHFVDWTYDQGQLVVTVAASHPLDALFFVRALERVEGFKNVAADRAGGDNTLRIRLTIDGK